MIHGLQVKVKRQVVRALERDRSSEPRVEAVSQFFWPWREPWLVAFAGIVAILDYTTTYAVLQLSGKEYVYEAGWLASWALRSGGFGILLLVDIAAVVGLSLIALAVRSLCLKFGYRGFGRAMFVFLLIPYVVIMCGIIEIMGYILPFVTLGEDTERFVSQPNLKTELRVV